MRLAPPAAEVEGGLHQVAQVVVETRVGSTTGLFDYLIPDELRGQVQVGQRVRVPFGKRTLPGFVYALSNAPSVVSPKPIAAVIDAEPLLPAHIVELAGFVADHYLAPLDEVVRNIVPPP
jgi:primosomal protein N' (replication factor Y)